jgi:hypothetical protein
MDVEHQTKLTKTEWESIEVPVSDTEKRILHMIQEGYHNLGVVANDHPSMISFVKIDPSPDIHRYLYVKYFVPYILSRTNANTNVKGNGNANGNAAISKDKKNVNKTKDAQPRGASIATIGDSGFDLKTALDAGGAASATASTLKKSDMIRLQNMESNVTAHQATIFDYKLLDWAVACFTAERAIAQQLPPTEGSGAIEAKGEGTKIKALYTLIHVSKVARPTSGSGRAAIPHVNPHVLTLVDAVVAWATSTTTSGSAEQPGSLCLPEEGGDALIRHVFDHAYDVIERNADLLRYANRQLYDHQKQLFRLFGADAATETDLGPMLVLYKAPTGTGKTVSPLGLSMGRYRIIYICAARHVGLALARSAISMHKRVAFAFGCETATDIRLHYHAAVDFTRNKKSGGIYKVDNSNGSQVEIMICDVGSYLVAMYYMLSFFDESRLILYWDEPTIGLDVPDHPLHPTIHNVWAKNKISRVVWSCATLPREHELAECFAEFRGRFDGADIRTIASYECKKTTTLVDTAGRPAMPHTHFATAAEATACVDHCRAHPVLLRYLDVREIVAMVRYLEEVDASVPFADPHVLDGYSVTETFRGLADLTMHRIKEYYITLLGHVARSFPERYARLHSELAARRRSLFVRVNPALTKTVSLDTAQQQSQQRSNLVAKGDLGKALTRMQSLPASVPVSSAGSGGTGILLTTADAHTLTDGPTIFLTEDVDKIGKFYLQQTKIPVRILDGILDQIQQNTQIQKKMDVLMKNLDDMLGTESDKDKKVEKEAFKPEVKRIMAAIEVLRADIKCAAMDAMYVPNTRAHQNVWLEEGATVDHACVPMIEEATVREIMELDVDTQKKVLLLLGIGVFGHGGLATAAAHPPAAEVRYTEIMKRLAYHQHLYLIIASSDYIYGTNYQFCHAFLGKDLANMTQQKILQAMGRIGRGNLQQEYTVRFRDETLLTKLWLPAETNLEAENMCRLFRYDD